MKTAIVLISVLIIISCDNTTDRPTQDSGLLTPQPFHLVQLKDDFWEPRLSTQATTLVPFAMEKTKLAVNNLRMAGQILSGDSSELPLPHRYVSSDLYKVMEGAALLLAQNRDPDLELRKDTIIDIIGKAWSNFRQRVICGKMILDGLELVCASSGSYFDVVLDSRIGRYYRKFQV
ncbi:MAG: hypothetical protein RIC35_11430 [Marinoscillum sp.]